MGTFRVWLEINVWVSLRATFRIPSRLVFWEMLALPPFGSIGVFLEGSEPQRHQVSPGLMPRYGFCWPSMSARQRSSHGCAEIRNIYGQRFTALGAKSDGEFLVNTTTAGSQALPAVAALGAGGFAVVWQSLAQDRSGLGVEFARLDFC